MHAAEIRRAVEAAPRTGLPQVAALLWKAYGDGQVSEAEAEALSTLIEARKGAPRDPSMAPRASDPQALSNLPATRRAVGSRPRSPESMVRRRRWAASGRLPPQVAAHFTLAQQAVLALVAAEAVRRGDCRLCHAHLAAVAGVAPSTVRATLRLARDLGLVSIEVRRITGWRNESSVTRIICPAWTAWNRLVCRPGRPGGGAISAAPTPTRSQNLAASSSSRPSISGSTGWRRGTHEPRAAGRDG